MSQELPIQGVNERDIVFWHYSYSYSSRTRIGCQFFGKCTLDREGDFSKPSNPAAALETKARCRRTGASLYLPTEGRAHRHTEENARSGTSAHTSHM